LKTFEEAQASTEGLTAQITMRFEEGQSMWDELTLGGRFDEARFDDGYARFV
jgi:hypothetical protein